MEEGGLDGCDGRTRMPVWCFVMPYGEVDESRQVVRDCVKVEE